MQELPAAPFGVFPVRIFPGAMLFASGFYIVFSVLGLTQAPDGWIGMDAGSMAW
jgi:hypothetical protein